MLRPTIAVDVVGAPDASWDSRRNKRDVRPAEANITLQKANLQINQLKRQTACSLREKRSINDPSPRVDSGREKDEKRWTCAAAQLPFERYNKFHQF